MKITNNLFLLYVTIMFSMLGGCANFAKAPDKLDRQAKLFTPDPDFSQVYLYRDEILGSGLSMPVTVDCTYMGSTGPKSFFKFNLKGGEHTFISNEGESMLTIDTKPGRIYYIWQEIIMGLIVGRTQLHLVNADQGKRGVLESALIDIDKAKFDRTEPDDSILDESF